MESGGHLGSWKQRLNTVRRVGPGQVLLAKTWLLLRGDERVLRQLPVGPGDWVLDVGAYRGDFTARMRDRGALVTAVEPIQEFASALTGRFDGDIAVTVLPVALGDHEGLTTLLLAEDGSSAWVEGDQAEQVRLVDVATVVGERRANLLKINAEGAEFDVLERLIETKQIQAVDTLLIQFHRFVPESRSRRARIRQQLKRTHYCKFNVPWVWEQWILRSK